MSDDKWPTPDPDDPSRDMPTTDGNPDATMGVPGSGAGPGEQPGSVIDRYKLIQVIGEGGFGTVFLADQVEPVSRRVALKVIKLGMDTKHVIARFEAERQALAMMDHPGIAKVFDAGATATGRPYFVMELVKGVPITTYCDRNRLDTAARLDLFKEVCAAVQHAHQKGVIHRDIKPSNVLVTDIEGQPTPKVIDFGIAKATNQSLTEKTVFTQQAQFIGTPAYMSPEQAGVTAMDIDTRSDIYSLGVLLYELLSGATPFDSKDLLSAGYGEIQRIIREVEPPFPSTRASGLGDQLEQAAQLRQARGGAQLVKNLKGELDWIVMMCLEKDRTRRYETANGLARDVDRFLNNEPVFASPPSKTYRLKKLIVRNKVVFAAGAVMVMLLAAGVTGTTIGLVRARAAEQAAIREAAKSEQVAFFMRDMMAGAGPSAARGRDTEMIEEILQETHDRIGVELAGQPEVEGEIRSHLGNTYFDLGQYGKAIEQFQLARDLLREAHGGKHGDVARQYNNLGLVHTELQEYEAAEENHRQALELRRELYPDGHADLGNNLVSLGNMLVRNGRYEEAEPLLLEGLEVLRKVYGEDHEDVAICLNSLGNLMQHLGRYEEAGPYYTEALRIHRATLGEDHPYVITDIYNLGWLALNTSDFPGASARFGEAVEFSRRVYGESHPKLIEALSGQARCEQQIGQLAKADSLFMEALDMAVEIFGEDHLSTADVMSNYATCLTDLDRDEESKAMTLRVYEIQKSQLGPLHPSVVTTQHNIAYSYYNDGDYVRAAELFQESLVSFTAVYGLEDKGTANCINNLARSLRGMGDLEAAEARFLQARGIRERVLGPDHMAVSFSNHDLSLNLYAQGRYAEAFDLIEGSVATYAAQFDSTHRVVGTALRHRAMVELELDRPADALATIDRARAITVGAQGADYEKLVEYDVVAAAALGRLGRMDEARARLEGRLPELDNQSRRGRAQLDVILGGYQAMAGDFELAEETLLSSYSVFSEDYGDANPFTRKSMTALVDLYAVWAENGSSTAGAEAARWQGKLAASGG